MLLLGSSLSAQFIDGTYWFDHMNLGTGKKLFAEATDGYLAFTRGSDLFVRSWNDVPVDAHPPGHGEVEVYEGTGYVELEVLGPYTSLAPGASTSVDIRWQVRPLPSNASRKVDDSGLLRAVRDLTE